MPRRGKPKTFRIVGTSTRDKQTGGGWKATSTIKVIADGRVSEKTFSGAVDLDRGTAISNAINRATEAAEKFRDTGRW